jgi:DNA-binding NarL/FixJ family response regulator
MDDRPSIRVMVVDDHYLTRHALARAIQNFDDMEVIAEAADGRQAVAAYAEHQPDVIIMDIAMPLVNGLEATRIILQGYPQARIIVLTGLLENSYGHQALATGAIAYLEKVIQIDELAAKIREVYDGTGL